MKYDQDKPKIHLVPPEAIIEAAKVFGFGAEKYGENNWRQDIHKFPVSRHYSSIQRHLMAYMMGEDNDPESGLPHLSHALTQMMILVMTTKEGNALTTDDRFRSSELDIENLFDGLDMATSVSTLAPDDIDIACYEERETTIDLSDLDNVTTITVNSTTKGSK